MTGRTVLDEVAAQTARTPEALAVLDRGTELTYAALEARANRLAHLLALGGAGPGTLVAVLVERSADLVVAVLGVLRAGAGYVPVEAEDPPDRVASVLADARARLVVASRRTETVARRAAGTSTRVVIVGAGPDERELAGQPDTVPATVGPDDVAYVIYTSGSTGAPKGVVVEHRALAAYIDIACRTYPAVTGHTLLHSSVSFDMAVTSLFPPLVAGGSIGVVDLLATAAGDPLPAGFRRPTFLKVTPSHLTLLPTLPVECSPTEMIVLGGEALLGGPLEAWRAEHPDVTVVNEYGPTEATVGCCVHRVEPGEELGSGPVPIGMPTVGSELYVLDECHRPVPDGEPGELHIAGVQLARGYLHRPDLTADRFGWPFGPVGPRTYRTGDLVRRRPDGALEFLGRADDQVKVNGHRVELGEVTAALGAMESVAQAAVVPRQGAGGRLDLVAYVVPAPRAGFDAAELRRRAAAELPHYMIPVAFVPLTELPLTANGKLDRSRLPTDLTERAPVAPHPALHADLLLRLFREVTGTPAADLDDDLLRLGGTSLTAAQLVTRARREGLRLELTDILRRRTVRGILAGDVPASSRPGGTA